jgi:predicted pyridoxine 5'-phosphate oxidase superfamily flavin-nucleotide-binding protein
MEEISEDLKALIENNALALATVDAEGKPHCIAVGYAKVVEDNQILITDNFMAETRNNIQKKPFVSLSVWTRNWEEESEGYELKGTAEYFDKGEWRDKVKKIPENRDEPCKGAILVTVNKIKKLA